MLHKIFNIKMQHNYIFYTSVLLKIKKNNRKLDVLIDSDQSKQQIKKSKRKATFNNVYSECVCLSTRIVIRHF